MNKTKKTTRTTTSSAEDCGLLQLLVSAMAHDFGITIMPPPGSRKGWVLIKGDKVTIHRTKRLESVAV